MAEIVRFSDCAIRIAVVVAGLLSVPGLRHVGAQDYAENMDCILYSYGVSLPQSEHVDIFPVRLVPTFPLMFSVYLILTIYLMKSSSSLRAE